MSRTGEMIALGITPSLVPKTRKVVIPSASVLTLRATPVVLVPAPGSNRVIQLLTSLLKLDAGGVAYTESTNNLAVRYNNGSGVIVSQTIEMTGFITGTEDMITSIQPLVDGIVTAANALGKALVLHNTSGAEFGNSGTGSLVVYVSYRVWEIN